MTYNQFSKLFYNVATIGALIGFSHLAYTAIEDFPMEGVKAEVQQTMTEKWNSCLNVEQIPLEQCFTAGQKITAENNPDTHFKIQDVAVSKQPNGRVDAVCVSGVGTGKGADVIIGRYEDASVKGTWNTYNPFCFNAG